MSLPQAMASVTCIVFLLMSVTMLATLPLADGRDKKTDDDLESPQLSDFVREVSDDEPEAARRPKLSPLRLGQCSASDYEPEYDDENAEDFYDNIDASNFFDDDQDAGKSLDDNAQFADPRCADGHVKQGKASGGHCFSNDKSYAVHATMTPYSIARTNNLTASKLAPEGNREVCVSFCLLF